MIKKLLLLLLAQSVIAHKSLTFTDFIKKHDKHYEDHEISKRFEIYRQNIIDIESHNSDSGNVWKKSVNHFSDLSPEEFKYLISRPMKKHDHKHNHKPKPAPIPPSPIPTPPSPTGPLPSEWDWSSKGAVTPIKDQGQCGSCWSFAAAETIESAWFISKGQLQVLSEQQLVDCSKSYGNMGCNGGMSEYAFEYVIANKGLCLDSSYPYTASNGKCKVCSQVEMIKSYVDVTPNNEQALMEAVYIQPVAVAIEADQKNFQSYSSGVMTAPCGTNLDHAVVVVGWGSLNGQPYWKVRNSWSDNWGEKGYILLARGVSQPEGSCGILSQPSYPVV